MRASHVAIVLAMVIMLYVVATNWHFEAADQSPGLRVKSPPYHWTALCPENYMIGSGRVLLGCKRREYFVDNPALVGLSYNHRGHMWYRIGDSAYAVNCDPTDSCIVNAYVANRFVR
jgi:hypothetical protein